jgi:hypothetical protein
LIQAIFSRRSLPEIVTASATCAIQKLWLGAHDEKLAMAWVSLFCQQASVPKATPAVVNQLEALRGLALLFGLGALQQSRRWRLANNFKR